MYPVLHDRTRFDTPPSSTSPLLNSSHGEGDGTHLAQRRQHRKHEGGEEDEDERKHAARPEKSYKNPELEQVEHVGNPILSNVSFAEDDDGNSSKGRQCLEYDGSVGIQKEQRNSGEPLEIGTADRVAADRDAAARPITPIELALPAESSPLTSVEPTTGKSILENADPFAKYDKHLNSGGPFLGSSASQLRSGTHSAEFRFPNVSENLMVRWIDCPNVHEIPLGKDEYDELAPYQASHPKSKTIFDVSDRLGTDKHPVVFGGSLGALGEITNVALINFPPTTNLNQILGCHCWQLDGKLGEGCLQIIIDWSVDILVYGYGKDPDVSEYLVRSCWGFVDITPIAGPGDWNSNPSTKKHYVAVAEEVKDDSKTIITDLAQALPNLESVIVFGDLPFKYAIKEGE